MFFFQSQALQWCVQREYPVLPTKETDKPVQFWQLRSVGGKVGLLLLYVSIGIASDNFLAILLQQ
jgi:hypothetical protein